MPVNIVQWRAKIGSFNSCSLRSVVKLHLSLFDLLFKLFLMNFCIIALTVCYITKFHFFLYLTTQFLWDFLPFLSTSISYSNFNHFSKLIFIKKYFANFFYIISFIDVLYSTYFLHILLMQHGDIGDIETNPGL